MDLNGVHRFGKSGYRNNYMPQIARQAMESRFRGPGMSTSSNSSWTFSNSHDIPKPRKGRLCGIFLIGAALIVALSVIAIGGLAFYIGGYSMEKHQVSEFKAKENIGAKKQYSTVDTSRKSIPKQPEPISKITEGSLAETSTAENNQAKRIPSGAGILGISNTMQKLSDGAQSKKSEEGDEEENEEETLETTKAFFESSTEVVYSTEELIRSVAVTKDVEILPKNSVKSPEENDDPVLGFDVFGQQNGHARPAYTVEEGIVTAGKTPIENIFPPQRDYSDEPWRPIIPSYRETLRVRYPYQESNSEKMMVEQSYEEIPSSGIDKIPVTFSKDSFNKNLRTTPEYAGSANNNFDSVKQASKAGQVSSISSEIAAKFKNLIPPRVTESNGHLVVDDGVAIPTVPPSDITIIKDKSTITTTTTTSRASITQSLPSSSSGTVTETPDESGKNVGLPIGIDQIMSSISMMKSNLKPPESGQTTETKTTPRAATIKTVLKVTEIAKPVKETVVKTKIDLNAFMGRAETTTVSKEENEDEEEVVIATENQASTTTVPTVSVAKVLIPLTEASATTSTAKTTTSMATTAKATTAKATTATSTTVTTTTTTPTSSTSTTAAPVVTFSPGKVNAKPNEATVVNPFLDDSRSSSSNFNFGLPDFPIIKQFHHLDSLLKSFSKPSGEGGFDTNKFIPRGDFGNDTSVTRFPVRTKQTTVRSQNKEESVFVQVSTIAPEKVTRRVTTPTATAATRRAVVVRGDVQVVSDPVRQLPPQHSTATTEIPRLITLLPVRSNVNMMRPLRPRPKSNVNGTFIVTSKRNAKMNSGFKTNSSALNRTLNRGQQFSRDKNEKIWVHYPSYKPSEKRESGPAKEKLHIVTPEPKLAKTKIEPAESLKLLNITGNLTNLPLYNTIESLLNADHRNREENLKKIPGRSGPVEPAGKPENPKNTSDIVDRIVRIMENVAISTADSTEAIIKVNQTVVNKTSTPPDGVRGNESVTSALPAKLFSSHYKLNQAGIPVLTKVLNRATNSSTGDDRSGNPGMENFTRVVTMTAPMAATTRAEVAGVGKNATTAATAPETAVTSSTTPDPGGIYTGCNSTNCSGAIESCSSPEKRCNQFVDCPDAADEKNCTCADHLKVQQLQRKLCDGIVDCWDFTDEYNCEWCKNEFLCSNSKMCIEKSQICDGSNDCPFGDDERNCVTISPSRTEAETFNYHSNGYLMVRKNGRWGKLCIDNFDSVSLKSKTGWKISDLGRSVCKALTFRDFDKVERMISVPNEGRSIGNTEKYYELAYRSDVSTQNGSTSPRESGLTFHETECAKKEVVKVTCTDLECGLRPQATSQWPRIVGGGNAGPGSWPWQAALYREGEFQCGGTLISEYWLISAGHCFFHYQKSYWVARLGTLRTTLFLPSPYEQLRHISEIILHPQYVDSGFINDISLLRMRDPVRLTDYVRPICLPKPETSIIDGAICTIVGWGQLSEVGLVFPDTLQEVQLPILSTTECRKRTLFLSLYKITDDMFCAGYDRGGRDACLGDSGGPLMCTEPNGKWTLYGITSNGYGCARSNRPGVYTKVSKYLNWINSQMAVHSESSPTASKSLSEASALVELLRRNVTNVRLHLNPVKNGRHACEGHRCPLGECLPKRKLCDGHIQCSDGSDEKDCW